MNIMIVGVGGQGTLLASRILGNLFLKQGNEVKISEVHGMSQRGGSVVTYVKTGTDAVSPTIEKGEADFIVAFELCEAARWVSYLKKDGKMLVSTQKIAPMPVITGAMKYPEDIELKLSQKCDVKFVDAFKLAAEAGNVKAVNVVLLGVLSLAMDIAENIWIDVIEQTVPQKFFALNREAFMKGRENSL